MPVRSDGDEIRRRRKLTGLSATEFAAQAGYSLNHVSQVELGHNNAGPQFLRKAAEIFGCDVSDLMTEDDSTPSENASAPTPTRAVA